MEQIIINKLDGSTVPMVNRRTATRMKTARQSWGLLGDDTVSVEVESPFAQKYDIGDKITIFGRVYKMNQLPVVKKNGMREFSYTITYEGVQYDLLAVAYLTNIETTNNTLQDVSGDNLTGNLSRMATVLIANANRVYGAGKWVLGTCPETTTETFTFSETDNCLSVLQNFCTKWGMEFDIAQSNGVNTLNLKEKSGTTFPYTFKFGRNAGLYELERQNVDSSNIITRLYVYGSSENITNKYRANRLCLPGKAKKDSFIESASAIAQYGMFEGVKIYEDDKPTFTGAITAIDSQSVLKFSDSNMFDLNAKDSNGNTLYLLADAAAKVHFNTGNLAGYEFEVAAFDSTTKTFTLKKQSDDRGDVFPSSTSAAFQFAVGDKYKLLEITLPDSNVTTAETTLANHGQTYYNQNSQPKVQYGLSVHKFYLEKLVGKGSTVNIFTPGDYIPIKDTDIGVDKSVRIKSIDRNLLDEYEYKLTISDTITTTITNRVISELNDHDKVITINNLKDPARARANWRSSREVLNMVFDPEGDYYTDKIKPASIDTLCLSVGAKSMQFGLQNTVIQPNYQGNKNDIKVTGGVLTHYTIVDDGVRSWVLADNYTTLKDESAAYYIFAKCEKAGTAGSIIFSATAIKVESDANYYHFLIGVINSVDTATKTRSIYLQYGFTMINGRFIKTGRVESADGTTYFDLDNSEIGGRIVFTNNGSTKTLAELGEEALESKNYINNTLPGILSDMQSQLDGQIEQWFYTVDPALDGEPNSEWTTTALKENHLGDLYYNTSTGKVWRYIKTTANNLTTYSWSQLSDEETAQALATANDALALAKTKRRIFTSTPYTPYEIGDLWVQGLTGEIMMCQTTRTTGNFTSSDWTQASKYTDDSALHSFLNNTYADDKQDLLNQIDGKIESWFQSSDPASSWLDNTTKAKHVGDMWFNTSLNTLWRYSSSYTWVQIKDQTAIDAYEKASTAQDTADGKRQVYVTTPTTPYDIGDLWVTGQVLLRCATARTASESYNVNDWVTCVYYDNTQTTIDGGIVTGGTIQVAGDAKSILAGMTGNGSDSASVRFWAGASFENRATAPYRVLQDGSVIMSKANVEGIVKAISGSIGGFKIAQGQIGVDESDAGGTNDGLSILSEFIKYSLYNDYISLWAGIGTNVLPTSSGARALARFEYTDKYSYGNSVIALMAKCRPGYEHPWYIQQAINYNGNLFGIGGNSVFSDKYIGKAYSDILESYVGIAHEYIFTGCDSSYLTVRLAAKSYVDAKTSSKDVTFRLTIICAQSMPNKIRITGVTNGKILNNDANVGWDGIDMCCGDILILQYYNGNYYYIQHCD